MTTVAIEIASNSYTHAICGRCSRLLYCSVAHEWDYTGFGWCEHDFEPEWLLQGAEVPAHVSVHYPPDNPDNFHRCNGTMRNWYGEEGNDE